MNDEPREKLCELIVEYGRSLCNDPRRCEALLKDYCGQYKREIFVLITALKNRVADDLLKTSAGVPHVLLLARLMKRLEDELGLAETAAQWAVESWALALGVIDQSVLVIKPAPVQPTPPALLPCTVAKMLAINSILIKNDNNDLFYSLGGIAIDKNSDFRTELVPIANANGFMFDEWVYSLVPFFARTNGKNAIQALKEDALTQKDLVFCHRDKNGELTGESMTERYSKGTITLKSENGGPSFRFRVVVKLSHTKKDQQFPAS